ncbi:helix-turn-helix domain-containing protein [Streptomyces sp. NPDC057889]|uniref:helix-turn-helix domain-containing protein n=1 Tax=unclassified Streptomyces TaxID=2593676 RepID=UPI0036AC0CA4
MPSVDLAPLAGRYLSFHEREEIALLRAQGAGVREIGRRLGGAPSTMSVQERLSGHVHCPDGTLVQGPETRQWKSRNKPHRQDRKWTSAWSPEQIDAHLMLCGPGEAHGEARALSGLMVRSIEVVLVVAHGRGIAAGGLVNARAVSGHAVTGCWFGWPGQRARCPGVLCVSGRAFGGGGCQVLPCAWRVLCLSLFVLRAAGVGRSWRSWGNTRCAGPLPSWPCPLHFRRHIA